MKLKLLVLTLFTFVMGFAQQKATITGIVSDKDMNSEPLPFASVTVKGTPNSTNTDENGAYTIKVDAGTHVLVFTFLGYETKEQTVTIAAGETKTVSETLGSTSVQLQDVVIEQQVNRQKESTLLLQQKNAVEIKQNIGAQELSRKGVGDVATAVTKTSGITRQEGSGNIFVRGLGDRYNSTTMNGLPIPSNNVDRKNISLEIFPTQIVEYISIDKAFMSRLYGDFAGGNVDIISKDYKGKGFFRVDIGSNINTNAISDNNFKLSDNPGYFGMKNIDKPSNPLRQYSYNSLKLDKQTPYAGSIGVSGGNSYDVGKEGKINFFGTASFANEYASIKDGKSWGDINGQGVANKRYDDYRTYNYNTNTTAMANVGYKVDANNKINFNSLYINTSNNRTEEYRGYGADFAEDGRGLIIRNKYQKTDLYINQLLGQHKFGERTQFNWGASYNKVKDHMPDRMQNKYHQEIDANGNPTGYTIRSISNPDNHRYFQDLDENEYAANATVDYKFNKGENDDYKGKLTAGYSGRMKKRELTAIQYNFKTTGLTDSSTLVDPYNADQFFNQANFDAGYFAMSTLRGTAEAPRALNPQFYNGDLNIHAALVNVEYNFSEKLIAVVGLRFESITQKMNYDTYVNGSGDSEIKKTPFLPSVVLKYSLTDKQNLRFAASKTYTLPQFKENVPFAYEEVTQSYYGNRYLYESDNYNADIKWEYFPKNDEVISLTAFGKYIKNPINEVTIASATNDISYVNSGDKGIATGAELEIRKVLWSTEETNTRKLTAGTNISYLHTDQDLDKDKVRTENPGFEADFTNSKSAFTGASNWLVNADTSYMFEWNEKNNNINPTLAFNYFSDRIFSLGTTQRGNLVDKGVTTMDFILKSKIKDLGISFAAKNLLDPSFRRVQENRSGDIEALRYKKGMFFSLSVNYQF